MKWGLLLSSESTSSRVKPFKEIRCCDGFCSKWSCVLLSFTASSFHLELNWWDYFLLGRILSNEDHLLYRLLAEQKTCRGRQNRPLFFCWNSTRKERKVYYIWCRTLCKSMIFYSLFKVSSDPREIVGDFSVNPREISSCASDTKAHHTSDDWVTIFHADEGTSRIPLAWVLYIVAVTCTNVEAK